MVSIVAQVVLAVAMIRRVVTQALVQATASISAMITTRSALHLHHQTLAEATLVATQVAETSQVVATEVVRADDSYKQFKCNQL